jgi:DNA-binding NarL/FixJ family response regulator
MIRARILMADDHTMICAGLQKILEPGYEVVGIVGDGRALLKAATELKPDVVLLDIAMPLLNGLDAARELRRNMPQAKLIFLTMYTDSYIASEAFRLGASAYLLKTSLASELLQAVGSALSGKSYCTPEIAQAMAESFERSPKAAKRPMRLSARQQEVLKALAEGRSMVETASRLGIGYRTVRFHKARIMEELAITSNAGLVQYALKNRLVPSV